MRQRDLENEASPGFTQAHTGHLTGLFLGSVPSLSNALFHSHSFGVVLSSLSNLEVAESVQEGAQRRHANAVAFHVGLETQEWGPATSKCGMTVSFCYYMPTSLHS